MSTVEQEQGDSRRRQFELAKGLAQAKNLQLETKFEGELFEDIGLSAYTGENITAGKLGKFLTALRKGNQSIRPGDYLLVESLDRVSRQAPMAAFQIFLEIINGGVTLVTTNDGREYKSGLDLGGMIESIVYMSRSHEESERKSDRISLALESNRKAARDGSRKFTSWCPAWLAVDEYDTSKRRPVAKSFKPIPARVKIVKRIFQESADGMGNHVIAARLFKDKIPSFGRADRWKAGSVEHILANRAVLGEFQPHKVVNRSPYRREPVGEPIKDYYPQIISPELFDRAQAAKESRKLWSPKRQEFIGKGGNRGPFIANLFSGIAICSYCESKMYYFQYGEQGGRYLRCSNARDCERTGWRYDNFESTFLTWVQKLDLESIMRSDTDALERKQLEEAIQADEGRRARLQGEHDNFLVAIAQAKSSAAIPSITAALEKCAAKIADINAEIERKRTQLATLASEAAAFYESKEEIQGLIEGLQDKGDDQTYLRRSQIAARLKALVSEIRVAPSGPIAGKDFDETIPEIKGHTTRCFSVRFKDGSIFDYTDDGTISESEPPESY